MPVHAEPACLLPALYLALAARADQTLADAADRAVAWALGLPEDSPLIPVADLLLAGPDLAANIDDLLGRLFAVPAFDQQVRPEDTQWHSEPGHALVRLAFELGYWQVLTLDHKILRMDADMAVTFREQYRLFEERFGRPPSLMSRCSSTPMPPETNPSR